MIPRRATKGGEYGERSALVAFLFNKSRRFHNGYDAGRLEIKDKGTRYLEVVQANYLGGDYLLGLKFGADARKYGIKKAIRKAKA